MKKKKNRNISLPSHYEKRSGLPSQTGGDQQLQGHHEQMSTDPGSIIYDIVHCQQKTPSYLSIVWDCWIAVLEVRKPDDPVVSVCEAAAVQRTTLKMRTSYGHTII